MLKVNSTAEGVTTTLNTGTSFRGDQEKDNTEGEEGRQDENEANIRGKFEREQK